MLLFIGFKNIILVLGIILLMRLVGKMMSARRNINDQNQHQKQQSSFNQEKDKAKRNFGKTSIHKIDKSKIPDTDYTDYEEVE